MEGLGTGNIQPGPKLFPLLLHLLLQRGRLPAQREPLLAGGVFLHQAMGDLRQLLRPHLHDGIHHLSAFGSIGARHGDRKIARPWNDRTLRHLPIAKGSPATHIGISDFDNDSVFEQVSALLHADPPRLVHPGPRRRLLQMFPAAQHRRLSLEPFIL